MQTIQQLGIGEVLPQSSLLEKLQQFTIRIIHNDPVSKHLSEARARKWRQLRNLDSARLPPEEDTFRQHCLRSHLQLYEYRNARLLGKRLNPTNFGWESHNDVLQPVHHRNSALPDSVQRRLDQTSDNGEDEVSDDEIDDQALVYFSSEVEDSDSTDDE
jgi:hypothetical protein